MTRRNHLMLDGIGQACIIIYYAFLFAKSSETIVLLQLFAISLAAWQFINGVLSYKFFEGQSKKQYVRVCGLVWISCFGLIGAIYLIERSVGLMGLAGLSEYLFGAFQWALGAILVVLPILLGCLILWYIYITIKDINIVINKTI
jgi:hypothetical protein